MKKIAKWLTTSKYMIPVLLLFVILGAGATMAWFTDTEAATNVIRIGNSDITVIEKVEELKKTDIGIKNEGSVPVYVRMRVDYPTGISYMKADGTTRTVSVEAVRNQQYSWTQGADDYWYYEGVVGPESKVSLYESVELKVDNPASGEMERIKDLLDITVYGECIQSEGLPEEINTAQEAFAYMASLPEGNE